jgi:tetratricopeptide (TPR) repeat protein
LGVTATNAAVLLVGCLLLLLGAGFAQEGGLQSGTVELRIRIFDESGRTALSNVRAMVQLTDDSGAVQAEVPADNGMASFRTTPGAHEVHIHGPNVRDYNGRIEIDASETVHMEVVQLTMLPAGASPIASSVAVAGAAGAPPVSVVRLKVPGRAEKEFNRGADQLEAGKFAEARKHFESAIAIYPDYDLAYNGIGVAAQAVGDLDGAQRAFEEAVARNNNFAMAWRNLAKMYLLHHDWAKADQALQRSLRDDPLNAWALTNAAWAELENHQFQQAVETALRVHQLPHQDFANAHYIAAVGLELQTKLHDALLQYETYLKEAPHGPNAEHARASVARLTTGLAVARPGSY